eukprot:TRINITY_DN51150_c0_g1_i1.p1 TRINITY_DN51150_c0_g1~~TRINITY_DN51150_c0_g1_i1.p1  ORF type:complete len:465 (-),score=77.56 TRINITY_DN51150_c0_g1_i1:282-1676(-)
MILRWTPRLICTLAPSLLFVCSCSEELKTARCSFNDKLSKSLPRVNATRLWASVVEMAQIGGFEGPEDSRGVRREALTDADQEGRHLLDSWAAELGLRRSVDEVGNTFYRWQSGAGRPAAAAIAFGSHLDSQPAGGRFDGSFGVLAGLEVLRTLREHGIETDLDLELVNWCNEEGSRFGPPMMGSGVATGQLHLRAALAAQARDEPDLTFGAELQRLGLAGEEKADVASRLWDGYLEAHIEQGPKLESLGVQVGTVVGGQGQRTFTVHVQGFEGHSGTVPMDQRQDALVCASAMVLEVRRIGLAVEVLSTVGSLQVSPGSFNTIPGSVAFSVDLRSPNSTALEVAETEMRKAFAGLAAKERCSAPLVNRSKARSPVMFHDSVLSHVRSAAESLGFPAPDLWSGAGHDACYVAERVPSAMIFVPCARGISHNPREFASEDDLAAGADVLLGAVIRLAGLAGHCEA